MSDVNANIGIQFDTANALAQLRQLQAGLSKFNQALTEGNVAAANAQKGLNAQLVQSINATGKFVASQKTIASSTASFTEALEKNKLSMTQYFKFTGAAATMNSKSLQGFFAKEKEILTRASKDRVKALQTQYVQLSNAQGDLVKVLQIVPKHLNMVNGQYADYATRTQMAAQRQQFLNQLIKQGSTQLLNFGKNTQWAGRQLMVGLTIPLTMLGSAASKVFREMEMAVVGFTRVYGDMTTGIADTDKAVAAIQLLAKEFTKYGITATETVNMAAKAAAMGLTGSALTAQVTEATRLAVLGQVEQQQALETTISLQNAFGISADQLAQKINFLNAVENQTVLSIEDLTIAIPKAGPVVKQLGGSVEDLAFFMTAMKEGGINASEGANALKSGLASLINPSKKASDTLATFGINIKGIVNANAGDLKGTVLGVARALDTLAPLERSRAIEQLFGKFQFARISALFQNIAKDGSQASKAFGLAGASVEELAILSERELGKVENAVGVKFQKSLENLKLQLIPIGKAFLEAVTPVVNFAGKIMEKFNNLSDGTKKFVVGFIAVLGGIAPVALMTVGLVANGVANLIKFFGMLRGGMAKLNGQNNVLGGGFDYLTQAEIENLAQSQALHTSHQDLITTFNVEATSVNALATAYANAASQARALASGSPGLFNAVPGPAGAVSGLPKKFATGGVVPGTGNGDTVPAMLTPGEVVLSKPMVAANPELVAGLMNGNVKRYAKSTNIEGDGFKAPSGSQTSRIPDVKTLMSLELEEFAKEFAKISKPGSQAAVVKEVKRELTIAAERSGEEISNTIKQVLAEAVQSVDTMTAQWVKDKVREDNPATGQEWRQPYSGSAAKEHKGEKLVFAHAARNGNDRGEVIDDPKELSRLSNLTADPTEGLGRLLGLAAKNGGSAFQLGNFGFMLPQDANKKDKGKFLMDNKEYAGQFTGPNAARALSPVLNEWARVQGTTLEEAMKNPEMAAKLDKVIKDYGSAISDEILSLPDHFGEIEFYDAVARANERVGKADKTLRTAIDNLLVESNYSVTTYDETAKVSRSSPTLGDTKFREDQNLPTETVLLDGTKTKPLSPYSSKKGAFVQEGDKIDEARASGALLGDAVIAGVRGSSGTDSASPSKKGRKAGKEVGDGLVEGLKDSEAEVVSQAGKLGSSAVPTAAETKSKVDKMDLTNKAFYDDLNTPELRDERQSLKAQDRNRRKRGATGTVDAAFVAQDVIREKSAAGISVTNNSTVINVEQAKADELQKEAARAEQAAAQIRIEAAKWEEAAIKEGSKGNTANKNVEALKKKAEEAELRAAELRIKAAEQQVKALSVPREDGSDGSIEAQAKAAEAEIKAAEARRKRAEQELAEAEQPRSTQDVAIQDPAKTSKEVEKEEELIANGTVVKGDLLRRSVAGSEDAADSTVLVADQTEELADATGEAVTTQLDHNENLITSAELTDVTAANLGEVVQATDETGIAQQDLADSSEEIAKTNDDILKLKQEERDRLKKYNAEAAAKAANNGTIPPTPQTKNKYGVPSTALGSTEAYEEAMGWLPGTYGPDDPGSDGYTKDKNGKVLIDPEFKAPTTLKKKALDKKIRGLRAEKVRGVSGKLSGGLGSAAMLAGMAGAPPQVTAALGTAATVSQFAPMIASLSGPQAAVAGIVALGLASKALNERFKAMARAQAKYIDSISATTAKMKKMGEITGKVGASELMKKRREAGSNNLYTEAATDGTTFGVNFLGDKMGKDMVKAFVANMDKVGAPKAAEALSLELAGYISDGVLSAEQANSIARAIGVNLKNNKIGVDIQGNLLQLVGPDGQDLKDKPISSRTKLLAKSELRSQDAMAAMNDQKVNYMGAGGAALAGAMLVGPGTGLAAGLLGYGFQQNKGAKEAAQVAALDANNIGFAQAQADAVAKEYSDKIRLLEAQKAATTDKAKQLKLQQEITTLTKEEADAAAKMNVQVAYALDSALKRFDQIQMGNMGRDLNQMLETFTLGLVESQAGNKQDAYFESLKGTVTDKYKGTAEESASTRVLKRTQNLDNVTSGTGIMGFLEKYTAFGNEPFLADAAVNAKTGFKGGRAEAQRFEAQLNLLMANGTLSPTQTEAMLDLFSGDLASMKSVLDFGIKTHGAAKTTELAQMLVGFKDKKLAKSIIMNITAKNPAEFNKLSATINKLSQFDGSVIDMEVVIKTMGMSGLASLEKSLDAIESIPNPITKESIIELDKKDVTDFSKVSENWAYYESLDPVVRKEAIQAYTTLFRSHATEDAAARQIWNEQWAKNAAIEATGQFSGAVYEQTYKTNLIVASKFTTEQQTQQEVEATYRPKTKIESKPGAGAGAGGGKGDDPLDFLDALAMRIKMVRDQSFNARKPIESFIKAFTSKAAQKDAANMFRLFDGIQQRLIALRAPKEFRDYIGSLDAEALDKLKNLKGDKAIFTFGKDKNGKIDKENITGFTKTGKAVMAAYNEAPLADFNVAQREVLENANNQFKAFTILKAAEVSSTDALKAMEDTAFAAALASGQLAGTDLKQYIKDLNSANTAAEKQAVLTDLIQKNADFKFKSESLPQLASVMKAGQLSLEQMKSVLSDPSLAKQLIDDLKDGKIDSEAIMDYLNNIDDEKFIEIKTQFNTGDFAASAAPGMELVNKLFATQEALLRNGVSELTRDVVDQVEIMKDDNVWMQEEIQRIQFESIKPLEDELALAQRSIEINITRKIEEYQKQVDDIQRNIELNFDRPIQNIQDRNTILGNDMNVMAHAAEEINEKYDKQVEALDAVEKINQRILRQQQQQLGLAGALSSGDIAAAARAAQEMRAANASDLATSTRDALQQARQTELDSQTGAVSGLTRKQIEEEQYQNSQKIYAFENARLAQMRQIQIIQDQIFEKEKERTAAQANITAIEDKIYNITQNEIKPLQDQMAENDLRITQGEREIQTQVDLITVLGETRDVWDKISSKIDASALAGEEFDKTMGVMLASVDKIDESWASILDKMDSVSYVNDEIAKVKTDVIKEAAETEADTLDLIASADAKEQEAIDKYKELKAKYDADYARLQASKNMGYTVQAYEQQYFNKTWAKGEPKAPVTGPTSAADGFDVSYNNPSVSMFDQSNAANLKNIKNKTTNNTTTNTSGGGGGGGTKDPGTVTKTTTTDPGSASQNTPGSKNYKPGTFKYVPVKPTAKVKPTTSDVAFLGKTSGAGLLRERDRATKAVVDIEAEMAKIGLKATKYDAKNERKDYLSGLESVASGKKEDARKLIEKYNKLQAYAKSWEKAITGMTLMPQEAGISKGAYQYIEEQYKNLSQPIKDQFEILKSSQSFFESDKELFSIKNKELSKLKSDYGYSKNSTDEDFKKETNKEIREALLTAWDNVEVEKGKMKDRNILVDNARALLKSAGFSNANSVYALTGAHQGTTKVMDENKTSPLNSWAVANWTGYSSGGFIPTSLSSKRFSIGTDTVPAMLTPGEFVMSRYAVNSVGVDNLRAINNGAPVGDSVYNYNLSVNVRSDANPDDIARTVMAQIKQIDSQRIRGNRI